ncbi:MAG: hypothetical protein K2R93_12455 [Gemmatimonadaceae bacterium]|nr:hypothetical protein [Gemmatimonadaceae bacterium]
MARQTLVDSGRSGGALVTLATTSLNAIADAAAVEVDVANDTDRDILVDLELQISFGTAPTADKTIDVYWRRTIDGTNYEDSSASRPPANGGVGSFVLDNTTSAQRKILPGVVIPPKGGKLVIRSSAGQTAASSGNVLRGLFYNPGIV